MVTEYIRIAISPNLIFIADLPFQSYLFTHLEPLQQVGQSIADVCTTPSLGVEPPEIVPAIHTSNRHFRVPEKERGGDLSWVQHLPNAVRITLLC
jgi:hypothetical protein